jgi:hypothetical protein
MATGLDARTHDPSTFNADDYSEACRSGSCDCAPLCPNCGKVKMWDEKRWPGHHDWHCAECHAYTTTLWKEN